MHIFLLILAGFFGIPFLLVLADWFVWIVTDKALTGMDWDEPRVFSLVIFTVISIGCLISAFNV